MFRPDSSFAAQSPSRDRASPTPPREPDRRACQDGQDPRRAQYQIPGRPWDHESDREQHDAQAHVEDWIRSQDAASVAASLLEP